jgi:hypothetical protein
VETVIEILRRAVNESLLDGWLFINPDLSPEKGGQGMIIDIDALEPDQMDGDDPQIAKQLGLDVTVESSTVEDIARAAVRLEMPLSDETLLEAFYYYLENDSFLPKKGYRPLPFEESQKQIYLDFYNRLGEESATEKCRQEGCQRGRIRAGIFCKVHHFEMIMKRPCPFSH